MSVYDLSHLTQDERQFVCGPIQDDEALFLYSIIKGMRIKRVLEIGGLSGYSAKNFLQAVGVDGTVYTCDINPVPILSDNHIFLHKNALDITLEDISFEPLEMIFFDCHDYHCQMSIYRKFLELGIINDDTVIALHDTNTHPQELYSLGFSVWCYPTEQGWVHQSAERMMVNDLVKEGWHPFCLHTKLSKHSEEFPFRHGMTVMTKFKELMV